MKLKNAPASVNAELMNAEQIRAKMEKSYKQIEEGKVYLAAEVLEKYNDCGKY